MCNKSSNLPESELLELVNKSYESRKKILRMMRDGNPTHLGGAFSCIDLLTVLYNKILRNDPLSPHWKDRDRFILSAGHKAIALYAVLQDKGYFKEEILWTFNKLDSPLPEHPDQSTIPGIEFPTGSLGHGLSAGLGMALAAKLDNSNYRVFVLLSEGECAEGTGRPPEPRHTLAGYHVRRYLYRGTGRQKGGADLLRAEPRLQPGGHATAGGKDSVHRRYRHPAPCGLPRHARFLARRVDSFAKGN